MLAPLPKELKPPFFPALPLSIRWNLEHENGRVFVNDQPFERLAPSPRPPGPNAMNTGECGKAAAVTSLHFVEAGDHGKALDPQQLQAVFRALDEANSGAGALVSLFVHGWQHSAAPGDSYACDFAKLISAVETMETHAARTAGRPPRTVLGVYVGWPGKLYESDLANSTTFWNRLQAADRLGNDGSVLQQLIPGLAQRVAARASDTRADRRSALVVTGHSMGGRAVFHALRNGLMHASDATQAVPKPDLVLLVNPAFSADLYRSIRREEMKRCEPIGVPLLSFSSEADIVTRNVYPAGQAVTYPRGVPQAAPFPEHIYTAANFKEFVTHHLHMNLTGDKLPPIDGEQSILRGFQRVPAGSPDELYRDDPATVYHQPPSGYPRVEDVWYTMKLEHLGTEAGTCPTSLSKVIKVDKRILPDHGRIFTPPFMEYVVRVLNRSARDGRGGAATAQGSPKAPAPR